MRSWALPWLVLVVGCSDPPPPQVTHQAAGRAVFARQHEECIASLRGLRDARNADDARVEDLRRRRDAAEAALTAAQGVGVGPAQTALTQAESALAAARARFEDDRDAIRRREGECDALRERLRDVR